MVKHGIILSCFCLLSLYIQAHSVLEGRVIDAKGQGLFSAVICLKQQENCCCYSDLQGYFSLDISAASTGDTLYIGFIGYKPQALPLQSLDCASLIEIKLQEDNLLLTTALIEHNPRLSEVFSLQKINKLDIYLSPVSDGDPLKAVSFLPASSNTSENANPEFRGSPSSASQVLLNGVSISAPVRNTQLSGMGNFSLFNSELIGDMTIYAGNPPLTRGNALAGLVEINTCDEIEQNQTQVAVSMANAGIFRSRKLGKEVFVQCYANHQFSEPYLFFNSGGNKIKSFSTNDAGLNFRWKKGPTFINFYAYGIEESFTADDYTFGKEVMNSAYKIRQFNVLNLGWRQGACMLELNSGNNLSRSDFKYGVLHSIQKDREWKTSLNFKYIPREFLMLQAGFSAEYLSLDFETDKPAYAFSMADSVPMLHTDTAITCLIPEIYLYTKIQLPGQLSLGLGVRQKLPSDHLPAYFSYQGNLRWKLNHNNSLLFSGGNYSAYYYPIYRYTRFSLQSSKQWSLEYNFKSEAFFVQAAAYHKREESPTFFSPEYSMKTCQRDIKGLEASLEYAWKGLRTSISCSMLHAEIEIDSLVYKAENDLPYFLKAYACYTTRSLFSLSCNGAFRPGLWYTPIESGRYISEAYAFEPQYGAYHSQRYDAYFKLDLSLNQVIFGKNQRMLVLFATLSNVLNRKNQKTCIYTPDYSEQVDYMHFQGRTYYLGAQLSF